MRNGSRHPEAIHTELFESLRRQLIAGAALLLSLQILLLLIMHEPIDPAKPDEFPPTRWTLIRRAIDPEEPGSFEALSELCETYWYPLYAYVRCQGAIPEDAADDVQGFFTSLLEKNILESADESKGRFRSFLILAIKRYRANEFRAAQTQKRGGKQIHFSIDKDLAEGRFNQEPIDGLTPEQIFDRCWAQVLLDEVLVQFQNEYTKRGKRTEFELLIPLLTGISVEASYAEIAAQLGITEGNLKVRVHRMKARYRRLLAERVSQTLDQDELKNLELELRHLLRAL